MIERRGTAFGLGALVSAGGVTVSWLCCVGPLALGSMGVGVAAFGTKLEPLRPWLSAATLVFLGAAFFDAYRPRRSDECAEDRSCSLPEGRRRQRRILWLLAVITIVLLTFPYWASLYTYLTL